MPSPPLTPLSTARLRGKIDTHKRAIAKHRDKLRELIGDVEEICQNCDVAERALEDAIDALSAYL